MPSKGLSRWQGVSASGQDDSSGKDLLSQIDYDKDDVMSIYEWIYPPELEKTILLLSRPEKSTETLPSLLIIPYSSSRIHRPLQLGIAHRRDPSSPLPPQLPPASQMSTDWLKCMDPTISEEVFDDLKKMIVRSNKENAESISTAAIQYVIERKQKQFDAPRPQELRAEIERISREALAYEWDMYDLLLTHSGGKDMAEGFIQFVLNNGLSWCGVLSQWNTVPEIKRTMLDGMNQTTMARKQHVSYPYFLEREWSSPYG